MSDFSSHYQQAEAAIRQVRHQPPGYTPEAMAQIAVAHAVLAVAMELRRYNEVALTPTTYHTNV